MNEYLALRADFERRSMSREELADFNAKILRLGNFKMDEAAKLLSVSRRRLNKTLVALDWAYPLGPMKHLSPTKIALDSGVLFLQPMISTRLRADFCDSKMMVTPKGLEILRMKLTKGSPQQPEEHRHEAPTQQSIESEL